MCAASSTGRPLRIYLHDVIPCLDGHRGLHETGHRGWQRARFGKVQRVDMLGPTICHGPRSRLMCLRFAAHLSTFAVLLASCTHDALLVRVDGLETQGEIVGGNRAAVFIRNDYQAIVSVPRASIRSVRHPGNVRIIVGSAVLVLGMLGYAWGLATSDAKQGLGKLDGLPAAGGGMLAAGIGIGVLASGLYARADSTWALGPDPLGLPSVPTSADAEAAP